MIVSAVTLLLGWVNACQEQEAERPLRELAARVRTGEDYHLVVASTPDEAATAIANYTLSDSKEAEELRMAPYDEAFAILVHSHDSWASGYLLEGVAATPQPEGVTIAAELGWFYGDPEAPAVVEPFRPGYVVTVPKEAYVGKQITLTLTIDGREIDTTWHRIR